MTQQEKERKAIEDFAIASTKTEHAILSNSLNESVQAYNDGKYIGIKLGAEFALSELRKTHETMKQTDEEIAKEYADGLVLNITGKCDKYARMSNQFDGYDLQDAYSNGMMKGCEQSDEKAMRFAEWTNMKGWTYNYMVKKWYNTILPKTALTEDLYNSQGFADYLKQFEK